MLYPLKFHPILKKKIWGGERLAYKSKEHDESIGESWEISAVEDNISVVSNGILADNDLQELIEVYMGDLVGDHIYEKFGVEFPLLIKYIDANDDLSIQVHPDDETAKERHNAYGKTEMWYIVDADKDASLVLGFNHEIDKATYLQALHQNKLMDLLNVQKVKKGESFFIPAGLVHAIGKGCLIAEIQQTSDITYRIYDYNRKDANGNTRELHTDLATDVIDYSYQPQHRVNYTPQDNQSYLTGISKKSTFTSIHLSSICACKANSPSQPGNVNRYWSTKGKPFSFPLALKISRYTRTTLPKSWKYTWKSKS